MGATSENTLNLPSARSAVLLLVDGLGLEQLQRHSAHAPFLRGVMKRQTPAQTEMSSVYPSTTAAGLSSLGTGLGPG
ncbi:MAG: alkaline phosphatase family protein, partial [Yaniella sp.]|nr:alkaline phosphatase family protein [Yaniella sp.]